MLEVVSPQKDTYDTSKTYLLEPLKYTCQHFSSVKDKIKVSTSYDEVVLIVEPV